jgi:ParB-like chromosome segregation protein Spo0J
MSGYQVMPRLSADEYADLEQSIKADGVLVPIIVSPGGEIIDGHHRAEIARRLGVHCPEVVKHGDATELRTFAYSLNLNRRHLTREQRRDLIAQSLRQDPDLSNREHARRTGTSDKTVAPIREELERRAEIPHVETRADSLGRQQPARVASLADEAAQQFAGSDADYARQAADMERELREERDAPKPAVQRRRALPQAFWEATHDLTKQVEKVVRLTDDDRFPQNAEQVAATHRGDLLRAIDALQSVLNRLPSA